LPKLSNLARKASVFRSPRHDFKVPILKNMKQKKSRKTWTDVQICEQIKQQQVRINFIKQTIKHKNLNSITQTIQYKKKFKAKAALCAHIYLW
jgi:hypothetical protein